MFNPIILPDRGVLSVSGTDARNLLQDLITANLNRLSPEAPAYGGLLTPQGKYLFDFLIFESADALLFDMAADQIPALTKRLTLYKLRADMVLEARPDLAIKVGEGQADPRHAKLPPRQIVEAGEAGDARAYNSLRISLGVPETGDFVSDGTFWLESGAERMNGVDFKKGCYVGQEQTARMKHRGTVKKGYRPFRVTHGSVSVGDEIEGSRALGPITSIEGDVALGFVRLGPFEDSEGFKTASAVLEPLALDTQGLP